jgi:hypothetical protein
MAGASEMIWNPTETSQELVGPLAMESRLGSVATSLESSLQHARDAVHPMTGWGMI